MGLRQNAISTCVAKLWNTLKVIVENKKKLLLGKKEEKKFIARKKKVIAGEKIKK